MRRSGPLRRGKPLRRTPLARSSGLARTGRVKPVSDRRRDENELRRDAVMAVRVRCRDACEACPRLAAAGILLPESARPHNGGDAHEVLTRARSGSIVDPANILWVCRRSHDWITANSGTGGPAERLGLVRPSWS